MTFDNRNKIAQGSLVIVTNDQFEKAMRKFKKKVAESGILQNLREREHYVKPTTRKKQAKSAARRRWVKKLEAEQLPKKLF
jgi:small subunit ribosomal protein S21